MDFRLKGFFVCLGVCAKFNFSVFLEINGGPRHERPRRNCAGHAAIYGERVDPENGAFRHAGYQSFWGFFVGERVPRTADLFLYHLDMYFDLWDVLIGCVSV